MIPTNYEEWRHCITVECGIDLTQAFIEERLAVWRNAQSEESHRFRRLYGEQHLQEVLGWFVRAIEEVPADE